MADDRCRRRRRARREMRRRRRRTVAVPAGWVRRSGAREMSRSGRSHPMRCARWQGLGEGGDNCSRTHRTHAARATALYPSPSTLSTGSPQSARSHRPHTCNEPDRGSRNRVRVSRASTFACRRVRTTSAYWPLTWASPTRRTLTRTVKLLGCRSRPQPLPTLLGGGRPGRGLDRPQRRYQRGPRHTLTLARVPEPVNAERDAGDPCRRLLALPALRSAEYLAAALVQRHALEFVEVMPHGIIPSMALR